MRPSHVFWLAALVALLAHALVTADNPIHLAVGLIATFCIFLAFSALLEFIDRAWANRRNPR